MTPKEWAAKAAELCDAACAASPDGKEALQLQAVAALFIQARNDALEEAAKVAEESVFVVPVWPNSEDPIRNATAQGIADKIRALRAR